MLFNPPSALETCCQLQGFQLAPSLFKILSIDRTSSRKIQEGSTMAATSVDMVKMICFRFSFQNFHRLLTQYFANTAYRPHSGLLWRKEIGHQQTHFFSRSHQTIKHTFVYSLVGWLQTSMWPHSVGMVPFLGLEREATRNPPVVRVPPFFEPTSLRADGSFGWPPGTKNWVPFF